MIKILIEAKTYWELIICQALFYALFFFKPFLCINLVVLDRSCSLCLLKLPKENKKENGAWIAPPEETLTQMIQGGNPDTGDCNVW